MKATATCGKCGELLTTDCAGCIRSGTAVHTCNGSEEDVISVEWKEISEVEDDEGFEDMLGED